MPKKNNGCDYNAQLQKLKNEGPGSIYLLYGPESYLRDCFLGELKSCCIPEGESSFNYHRFDGPNVDDSKIDEAINSVPFLGDKTFIEIHDMDFAKSSIDYESVPEYCVIAFVSDDVDNRLKAVKNIDNKLCFDQAEPYQLYNWIKRRFKYYGKTINDSAIKRLIYVSGELMNGLIPEIEKISGYSAGPEITVGCKCCCQSYS